MSVPEAASIAPRPSTDTQVHLGPARVLIACGGLEQRERVAAGLRGEGVLATPVDSIDPESVATYGPDAVVLLRGGDPASACKRLKSDSRTAGLPILIFSQAGALEEKMQLVNAGADTLVELAYGESGVGAQVLRSVSEQAAHRRWGQADALLVSLARRAEHGKRDHGRRTVDVAEKLGAVIGLSAAERASLRRAALLHDIGEITLPDLVLLKAGRLTMPEWEAERAHPMVGADLISVLLGDYAAAAAVRAHHERLDGSGYPRGLSGRDVPLLAQVLALADVYSALTAARPHRPAKTTEDAIDWLRRAAVRGEFDTGLVKSLERIFPDLRPVPEDDPEILAAEKHSQAAIYARPEILGELSALLSAAGCEIRVADALAANVDTGVVVVDLGMDPNALESISALRKQSPDVEVLVVPAQATYAEVMLALRAGATEVIDLAAGHEDAAARVARAVARWRARRGRTESQEQTLLRLEVMERVASEREGRLAEAGRRLAVDGTLRERATAELQQLRGHLVHGERLSQLGRLAAHIIHEINNPLSFVRSNLSALVSDLPAHEIPDDVASALRESAAGVERIVSIVRDMRAYARVDTGTMVTVDLNHVLKTAQTLLAGMAQDKVRLEISLNPVPPVLAEESPLVQVVMNLVSNAIDASPLNGKVKVRTLPAPDGALVQVEDQGPGVPEKLRDRIFEPFFTTKAPGAGSGVGLAICKDIAARMGGQLMYESRPGCTIFSFWLPAQS